MKQIWLKQVISLLKEVSNMKEVFGEIFSMLKELGNALCEAVKEGVKTFNEEIKELKEDIKDRNEEE